MSVVTEVWGKDLVDKSFKLLKMYADTTKKGDKTMFGAYSPVVNNRYALIVAVAETLGIDKFRMLNDEPLSKSEIEDFFILKDGGDHIGFDTFCDPCSSHQDIDVLIAHAKKNKVKILFVDALKHYESKNNNTPFHEKDDEMMYSLNHNKSALYDFADSTGCRVYYTV